VFGNHKVFFNVLAPHETLRVTATTQVLTTPAAELAASAPWELVREAMAFRCFGREPTHAWTRRVEVAKKRSFI
jgi:hypothetical protein